MDLSGERALLRLLDSTTLSAQHSAWRGAGPWYMFPELTQLLKGEERHGGLEDTQGKQEGLCFVEKRKADQKSWEMEGLRPTLRSQRLHPERGSKQGPEKHVWLFL